MGSDADDLARKARTLAQAHPLSPLATQFVNQTVAEQSASQPVPEIGTWAGTCLLNGYCLRQVEENAAGLVLQPRPDAGTDVARLAQEAARIAAQLRAGADDAPYLIGGERVVAALDRIISSEVSKRLDNLRNALDKDAIVEIEEFLTWWTVQGYGLRAAEKACGSVA